MSMFQRVLLFYGVLGVGGAVAWALSKWAGTELPLLVWFIGVTLMYFYYLVCPKCRKSVFRRDKLSMSLRSEVFPERVCSRCGHVHFDGPGGA